MAEHIEREAAIEAVTVWYKKAYRQENMSSYNMGERAAYITAISEIAEIPAADVRPVVRGTWRQTGGKFSRHKTIDRRILTCSVCGNFLCMEGVNAGRGDANSCPNCGDLMKEDRE
jgi:hypothetical protein